jgi:hypothetical protein
MPSLSVFERAKLLGLDPDLNSWKDQKRKQKKISEMFTSNMEMLANQ